MNESRLFRKLTVVHCIFSLIVVVFFLIEWRGMYEDKITALEQENHELRKKLDELEFNYSESMHRIELLNDELEGKE